LLKTYERGLGVEDGLERMVAAYMIMHVFSQLTCFIYLLNFRIFPKLITYTLYRKEREYLYFSEVDRRYSIEAYFGISHIHREGNLKQIKLP